MHPLGIEVGWFTRCSSTACGVRIPITAQQRHFTCWNCRKNQPLVPISVPWPAAITCRCGKMIPYGPGRPQIQCPYCRQGAAFGTGLYFAGRPGGLRPEEAEVLEPLAGLFGLHSLVSACLLVTHQGWRVWTELDYWQSEDADPPPDGFTVYAESYALPQARMKREGVLTRIGKSLGLVTDVEIGEASFDQLVLVEPTDDPSSVAAMLRSPSARERIKVLLSSGAEEVRTGQLTFQGSNVDLGKLLRGENAFEPTTLGPFILAASFPLEMAHPETWAWAVQTIVALASDLGWSVGA